MTPKKTTNKEPVYAPAIISKIPRKRRPAFNEERHVRRLLTIDRVSLEELKCRFVKQSSQVEGAPRQSQRMV